MRRLHLHSLLAAGLLLAAPCAAKAQAPVNEVRAASPTGAVRIHNLVGTVRVTGWDRDSILVLQAVLTTAGGISLGLFANGRRIGAMARKEFIHIFRDPRSLGMGIAIPMIMLLLFGYALTLDVDKVPMVIWDQSRSQASREFISHFLYTNDFRDWELSVFCGGGRPLS